MKDLDYAARVLWRSPVFTAVAIVTLSLGIGANSAMFSAIDAVLFRSLPFERAADLYVVSSTYQRVRREYTSFTDFTDWRARSRAFTHMAAIRGEGYSVATPAGPDYLHGAAVSEDFFALLAVRPFLGRSFAVDEHRPGRGRVVLLSHGLWLRRFGGDPDVIDTAVVLDEEVDTVVGVLPADFAFPDDAELWRPLTLTASDANRRADIVRVVARLRPETPVEQAQAEMSGIARQLEQRYPRTNANWGVALVSLHVKSTESVRRTLLALWGAVACVLLIACANIGILLVSRTIRRTPELAVRSALGAGHGRIVRQLLSESVLLAMLGAIGSLVVANWGIAALRAVAPVQTPRLDAARLDLRVLLFTAAVSLGVGLLAGLVPARRIMGSDLQGALKEGAVSVSGRFRHHRTMRGLVMAQVALSIVLLTGAGLMIRTLERLQAVNLGFNPDRLLTFYVSLPEARYAADAQLREFFDELLERVRALPHVSSASAINALYIHWSNAFVISPSIEGRPAPDRSDPPDTHIRIVDADIHRVLQIPVVRGRSFAAHDGPNAPFTAVINDAMARRYFPGEDPIGQRVSVLAAGPGKPIWQEIVGVVGDVRQRGLDTAASPEIQIPYTQSPIGQMAILVRTSGDPAALAPSIRAQLQTIDPSLPMTFMQTMDEVLAKSMAARRFGMSLLSAFAIMALVLAAIGIYGVMAALVSERTGEIAVRLAFGASPRLVVRMFLARIARVATTGVAAGIVVALGVTRYLEPLLFGIARTDAATYATTAGLLTTVMLFSGYLATRRVTRIDPVTTLRSE